MLEPMITQLNYTYKKPDTDVRVLNMDDVPIDMTKVHDQQIINIGPLCAGGNHKHSRVEWLVGFGNLELVWLDDKNQKKRQHMNPEGEILLFEVPAQLPHAVVNLSKTDYAMVYEWADGKMVDVERVKVI